MELPAGFRTSERGWFDLAFTMWADCQSIKGGVSALTDALLGAMDFPIQIHLPVEGEPSPVLHRSFGILMTDAKALQQMVGAKPSGSYKTSLTNANLVGRVAIDAVRGPYLQHYTCNDPRLWDTWTSARWHEAAALVAAEWTASPERGAQMELLLGIYHNEGLGLPYSTRAHLYRVPETVQWDAQHCIWASGGIGQYEANGFVQEAVNNGIPLDQIQDRPPACDCSFLRDRAKKKEKETERE